MASLIRKNQIAAVAAAAMVLLSLPLQAFQTEPFYNVDTEIRISGTVEEIKFEPRYKDRAPFLVIVVKESEAGLRDTIEVGPSWFFGPDLHQGEQVEIIGSVIRNEEGMRFVIARELRIGGETLIVRDSRGFPGWRGGGGRTSGRRRGRGF